MHSEIFGSILACVLLPWLLIILCCQVICHNIGNCISHAFSSLHTLSFCATPCAVFLNLLLLALSVTLPTVCFACSRIVLRAYSTAPASVLLLSLSLSVCTLSIVCCTVLRLSFSLPAVFMCYFFLSFFLSLPLLAPAVASLTVCLALLRNPVAERAVAA